MSKLYGEQMRDICAALGVDVSSLPDNLYSTLLNAIKEAAQKGGSVAKLTLFTPTISIDNTGEYLSITDKNGGFVELYDLYAGGEFVTAISNKTILLNDYIEYTANLELKVQAKGQGFNPSEYSNIVNWFIPDGSYYLRYGISSDKTEAWCLGLDYSEIDEDMEMEGLDIVIADYYQGAPVTAVDDGTFEDIGFINSVVIGDNVTLIGFCAFGYNHMGEVILGNSVETIDEEAFFENSIQEIVFPPSVTHIGLYAFGGNEMYRADFSQHTNVPTLGSEAFERHADDFQIKVPAALIDEWKNATNWSDYADYIVTEFTN